MSAAFWLAGTAAASAIADIHRGERLAPLLGEIDRLGDVSLTRVTGRPVRFAELMSQRYQVDHREAMRLGTEQLDANVSCAHGAVFVTDHVLDVDSRAIPVILLDIRAYTAPSAACTMVIPYRAASSPLGFGTHRPTVIEANRVGPDELECLMGSFFAGLENHQTGWEIWRASVVRELDTFYAV